MIHKGGCHCGKIEYQLDISERANLIECNCSICSKTAYLHLIVAKDKFTLLKGENELSTYTFDTHEAKHMFCKTCGIKSIYIPRSHPNGVSVNARCLANFDIDDYEIELFDGLNWEENIAKLKKLD